MIDEQRDPATFIPPRVVRCRDCGVPILLARAVAPAGEVYSLALNPEADTYLVTGDAELNGVVPVMRSKATTVHRCRAKANGSQGRRR